jgi:hypothetical protein
MQKPFYCVEPNPHFGDRGEGRNRWLVVYVNEQGRSVIIGKYMTKKGADGVAAHHNAKFIGDIK